MEVRFVSDDCADVWEIYPFSIEDLPSEIWLGVPFHKDYFVSTCGRLKSVKGGKPKILKPKLFNGYFMVSLYTDNIQYQLFLHRIVAKVFLPNPDNKPQVNHRNGIKTDNRVENLEWVTQSENQLHAYSTGLQGAGENGYQAKLTNDQVEWARENYVCGSKEFGSVALAKMLGISQSALFEILVGQTYKDAGGIIHSTKPRGNVPTDIRREIQRLYKPRDPEFGAQALARKFGLHRRTVERIAHENE